MLQLIFLLVAPVTLPFLAKAIYPHEITFKELFINLVVGVAFVCVAFVVSRYGVTADVEIVNGAVTSKQAERVSCSHSYPCNCRPSCTGSGKTYSCTTTCDICYSHSFDMDYVLLTSVGRIYIDRVDSQGLITPNRFIVAKEGDPVAVSQRYQNYIKAAPDSLFNKEQVANLIGKYEIPAYPDQIYDYHYVNRVLSVGTTVPDAPALNQALAEALRTLGPRKQVNAVFVFTKHDSMFSEALEAAWLGGKKNDVIVVLGTPNYPQIDWVRVISWTDNQLFKVELRDALVGAKTASTQTLIPLLSNHLEKSFVRKPMEDFAYLENLIQLPTWLFLLLLLMTAGVSGWLAYYFAHNAESTESRFPRAQFPRTRFR